MIEEIAKKHVVLSMGNGHILEGFVEDVMEKYLTLIEQNNQKVIVKIQDISFVRLGAIPEPVMYSPSIQHEETTPYPGEVTGNGNSTQCQDFSMPLPKMVDNPYLREPSFVRSRR